MRDQRDHRRVMEEEDRISPLAQLVDPRGEKRNTQALEKRARTFGQLMTKPISVENRLWLIQLKQQLLTKTLAEVLGERRPVVLRARKSCPLHLFQMMMSSMNLMISWVVEEQLGKKKLMMT